MHQPTPPLPLERQVRDLGNQIIRARIFYDFWWQLQGEPMDDHLAGMNLYPDFFRFSRHAYLYAMVVQTMIPFDQRRDSLSFKTIIKEINKDTSLRQAANEVESIVSGSATLWRKMKVIRDECFAHRSRLSSYDAVWTRAAIRPMDIYCAQSTALEAINLIERALRLPLTALRLNPGKEATALLATLQARAVSENPV